ncbi:15686_t:CDS:1, partial [Dentiscutata erythropus]
GCNAGETGDCGATIKSAKWSPGNLEIQVVTPDSAPQAFGHFTFADDQKHGGRFLKRPVFVNCQECTTINNCQINPFTSNWTFDPSQTPQKGVWFDIWISVYWFCTKKHGKSVRCTSEDIQFRDIVR